MVSMTFDFGLWMFLWFLRFFVFLLFFLTWFVTWFVTRFVRWRSNKSCRFPMVGIELSLVLHHMVGERSPIADSITVSEVSLVPLLLTTHRSEIHREGGDVIAHPGPAVSVLRAAGGPVRTASSPGDLSGSEGTSSTAPLTLSSAQQVTAAWGQQWQHHGSLSHKHVATWQISLTVVRLWGDNWPPAQLS